MSELLSISKAELEDIILKSAKRGAKQALDDLGLDDESAQKDVYELRQLLDAYRAVKKGMLVTFGRLIALAIVSFAAGSFFMTQIGGGD